MKPYTLTEIERAFNKVEMEIDKNGKHIRARFTCGGKRIRSTHFSHGRGSVGEDVIRSIRNQLDLDNSHFTDLLDCPLKRPGLIEYYRGKNYPVD